MSKLQKIAIAAILAIGLGLGALILHSPPQSADGDSEHAEAGSEHAEARGARARPRA